MVLAIASHVGDLRSIANNSTKRKFSFKFIFYALSIIT